MTGRPPLLQDVRDLLDAAVRGYAGTPGEARLRAVRERLDEPLRVAIAGKVKAGKSTLLNALVGEEVAPTDAGECTTIVTWYRDGTTYRATLHDEGAGAGRWPCAATAVACRSTSAPPRRRRSIVSSSSGRRRRCGPSR